MRQIPGEPRRRWFNDEAMDLYVWYADNGDYVGFQLTYGKPHAEKALTWKSPGHYDHLGVDQGTRPGKHPGSPLLVADGVFDAERTLREFRQRARNLDPSIERFVTGKVAAAYHVPRRAAASGLRWRYALAALGAMVVALLLLAWL